MYTAPPMATPDPEALRVLRERGFIQQLSDEEGLKKRSRAAA